MATDTPEIESSIPKSELIKALDLDQLTTELLVEAFNCTNEAEPLAEGWTGLERFARKVEQLARTAERFKCWQSCPECGAETEVENTFYFSANLPFERVCYQCGWFDERRYHTREEAEKMKYRLLVDGEIVQESDEYLSDDCTYWIKAQISAGAVYSLKRDTPCRRLIS